MIEGRLQTRKCHQAPCRFLRLSKPDGVAHTSILMYAISQFRTVGARQTNKVTVVLIPTSQAAYMADHPMCAPPASQEPLEAPAGCPAVCSICSIIFFFISCGVGSAMWVATIQE